MRGRRWSGWVIRETQNETALQAEHSRLKTAFQTIMCGYAGRGVAALGRIRIVLLFGCLVARLRGARHGNF